VLLVNNFVVLSVVDLSIGTEGGDVQHRMGVFQSINMLTRSNRAKILRKKTELNHFFFKASPHEYRHSNFKLLLAMFITCSFGDVVEWVKPKLWCVR
jgi:hypothetical protein